MEGWISVHRKIWEHWLIEKSRPLTRLEAWLKILMEVNHEQKKVSLGNELIIVKRGESINSLDTWARLFNWDKSKVRRFFKLLESDSMIVLKSNRKTTHLNVCNYGDYQDKRNIDETQMKRKRNANETQMTPNNNGNNDNKGISNIYMSKNFDFKTSIIDLGVEKQIAEDWMKVRAKKKAANTKTAFNAIKKQIEISGVPANECVKIAAEKSWQGLKAEWIINEIKSQPANKSKNLLEV